MKFFCCANGTGVARSGGGAGWCPGSTAQDSAGFALDSPAEYHLYNIAADRFELPANDLAKTHPDLVREMAKLLPAPHVTAASPDSRIKSQAYGYRWAGCTLCHIGLPPP